MRWLVNEGDGNVGDNGGDDMKVSDIDGDDMKVSDIDNDNNTQVSDIDNDNNTQVSDMVTNDTQVPSLPQITSRPTTPLPSSTPPTCSRSNTRVR